MSSGGCKSRKWPGAAKDEMRSAEDANKVGRRGKKKKRNGDTVCRQSQTTSETKFTP